MVSPRDENNVAAILVTSSTDGKTPIRVYANPSTHEVLVSDGTTGSGSSSAVAARDENSIPVWLAVSSSDGNTVVPVWGTSNQILIQST